MIVAKKQNKIKDPNLIVRLGLLMAKVFYFVMTVFLMKDMKGEKTMEATENIYGTSLQGYIKASYEQLLKAFGPPNPNLCDKYKTDVEWAFEFADGTVATLYNWKNGKNYCGKEGLELNDIYEWNVGGRSEKAVSRLLEKLRS